MEYRKSMRPAVGGDVATIFVAIELSTKSWLVALQTSLQDRPSRHQLAARDVGGLMALIGWILAVTSRHGAMDSPGLGQTAV